MSAIRFDSQVAIVTGAERGLGRAYAQLLLDRGAAAVVNDVGTRMDGTGKDASVAEAFAGELAAKGRPAVASGHDVGDLAQARALVHGAIDRFGRLDIVVNTRNVIQRQSHANTEEGEFRQGHRREPAGCLLRHPGGLAPSSGGSTRPCDDRVFLGFPRIKLLRLLVIEGGAGQPDPQSRPIGSLRGRPRQRVLSDGGDPYERGARRPSAPRGSRPAVYLISDEVRATGEVFINHGSTLSRIFVAVSPGFDAASPPMEEINEHWEEVMDHRHAVVPADMYNLLAHVY